MRQLSGADSMFLQFERGNNFMHVASLAIYDPSTAPGGGVRSMATGRRPAGSSRQIAGALVAQVRVYYFHISGCKIVVH